MQFIEEKKTFLFLFRLQFDFRIAVLHVIVVVVMIFFVIYLVLHWLLFNNLLCYDLPLII